MLQTKFSIVLVHGAGSYGHIPVLRYGLAKGLRSKAQLGGLAEVKSRLIEWQYILTRFLRKANIPCISLQTSDVVTTSKGRIRTFNLESLRQWLNLGCVPTLGGDIVHDSKMGFAVVSGDQLAAHLAVKLKASKLIFATDVDGIFDSNAKAGGRPRLMQKLTPFQARKVGSLSASASDTDVTGGMVGKIMEASRVADKGVPVYFVNLMKDELLRKIALGLNVKCSVIKSK